MPLAPEFCAARPDAAPSAALEDALARAVRAGREAWPAVPMDDAAFVRHLAERVEGDDAPRAIDACHAADLWLACACARGEKAALDAFAAAYLALVPTYLAKAKAEALADDVRQILSARLFVAEDGRPKILEYSGRGPLGAWVRVAAVRTAVSLQRAPRAASDDAALAAMAGPADPELDALKLHLRGAFERALLDAFAALPPRDRTLLKLHHADGVPVDVLARAYRVHRVSASRWLSEARARVMEGTRARLRERLAVGDSEFSSIVRLVQSNLELTMGRLLGTPESR